MQQSIYKQVDQEMEQAKEDGWPEMPEISADVYVKSMEKVRGKIPWEMF